MINKSKSVLYTIAILPLFVLSYLLVAFICSRIAVNANFRPAQSGIEIFIKTNGVHTDIVVPACNPLIDWTNKISPTDFNLDANSISYLGFGWGDKGFYLETPTWSDLKFSTAFRATFGLGTTAMHVSAYSNKPIVSAEVKKIVISVAQYTHLLQYIESGFQKNAADEFLLIRGAHYGKQDCFYEAIGVYSLFKTCNCWTSQGLKDAGVNTAVWAPFDWAVMRNRVYGDSVIQNRPHE